MQNRVFLPLSLVVGLSAGATCAAGTEAPLSAIPWLSETLDAPPEATESPSHPVQPPAEISVTPIDGPNVQATGLLSPAVSGLSVDLWVGSDTASLTALIRAMPDLGLPALQTLFDKLMLLEATPPPGAGESLLLARVDALILRGQTDPAQALLERAGPDTPELFRRWFDLSLLNGTEDRACATLAAKPDLSPNYETRIFCLARAGRWPTAALTLETATAFKKITPESRDLLARFLDPDLFEGDGDLPRPEVVTPLQFRLLEAVGEPVPITGLPLAFAQTELRHIIGWKAQIEATERLARAGAVSVNSLLGTYTSRKPAASGGVWDRVALIQQLDIAITAGNAQGVAAILPLTWSAMHDADLDAVFAELMAERLSRLPLPPETDLMAYELALISNGPEAFQEPPTGVDLSPNLTFAAALTHDGLKRLTPADPFLAMVRSAFAATTLPPEYARMVEQNRTGEAMLTALTRLAAGREADPDDTAAALQFLNGIGQQKVAIQAALQLIFLTPRG